MNEFIEAVGQLAAILDVAVEPFVSALARLSGLLLLLPGIGMRIVPVKVKAMLVVTIAYLLVPTIAPMMQDDVPLIATLGGEVVVGAALGFSMRLFIFILSIAGATIAQSLSLSQIFGAGISEEANTTVSTILTMAGTALFLTLGFHIESIAILVASYREFEPGGGLAGWIAGGIAETVVVFSGQAMRLALMLSMPFLLMNLTFNLLLGIMNKAMPQLMVTFVGLPGITLSGIILLLLSIPHFFGRWLSAFSEHVAGLLP